MIQTTQIHLIAPSYPLTKADVRLTISYLENLGMQTTVPSNLLGEDLLCANKDEIRLTHLLAALNDPIADIIWLLDGGYGLTRLIPHLFEAKKPTKEKLFIGFSDGTALHTFLGKVWNWISLHGSCASEIAKKEVGISTITSTINFIKSKLQNYIPPTLKPINFEAEKLSSLAGIVVGGNLSILQCSVGTKWQLEAAGKILFLEDIGERGYRIDRMLAHLEQASLFENINALIFGDFVDGFEVNGTSLVHPVLQRFAEDIKTPVFSLPGCGHGKENFPLPLNVHVEFVVKKNEECKF